MSSKFMSLALVAVLLMLGQLAAQSDSSISYQGELMQAGAPANGLFNMEFELFNTEVGGSQVGSTVIANNVPVINGRFTAQIDFGADVFDNSDRWLQIAVNGTTLVPRQPITRTPYAIQTRGLYVNDSETFAGIGRMNQISFFETFGVHTQQMNNFGGMYVSTEGEAGLPYYGYSAGGTSSDFDAYHYYDGLTDKWHLYNGGIWLTVLDRGQPGGVGIGTTSPSYPLHVDASGSRAIYATNDGATGLGDGVVGESSDPSGYGVWGRHNDGGEAGHFSGDVNVVGALSKSSGSFKIDHPLDPENKYLYHSFVESPDMMNIYNGNVTTDGQGYATVEMPEWFEALNREFRYQLTVVDDSDTDDFVLAKVVQRIESNQFRIRTSQPLTEVSWQVTGVRHDAYAQANRIPVEQDKAEHERGFFLHPEPHGASRDKNMISARKILQERQENSQTGPSVPQIDERHVMSIQER